jgi:hypothetical protein
MYSTYDPNLPSEFKYRTIGGNQVLIDWSKVNYLLNLNVDSTLNQTVVQAVIFYFTQSDGHYYPYGTYANVDSLIDKVNQSGEGFYPNHGQLYGVVLEEANESQEFQDLMIQVDP